MRSEKDSLAAGLRALLVVGLPVAVFLLAVGAAVARSSNEVRPITPAQPLAVNIQPASRLDGHLDVPRAVESPLNRADCISIRGSAYQSGAERDWFLSNCSAPTALATPPATAAAAAPRTATATPVPAVARPAGPVSVAPAQSANYAAVDEIYGSSDRLVIKRLGVNAPVNIRPVGPDGVMGNPLGANDVVLYDFSGVPGGLGGYPGKGGNTVIAGHVDYICCLAVFAPLRNIQEGDLIDYYTGDGNRITYAVQWFADYPEDSNWNSVVAGGSDVLTLFTCNGTFNSAVHSYDHRRVVRAARVQS